MITWVMFLAIGLLVGIGVGIYVSRLDDAAKRQKDTLTAQLQESEQKMQSYKTEVEEHFVSTAELVNNMTASYFAVHEKLSQGAKELCDHKINVEKIPLEQKSLLVEETVIENIETTTSNLDSSLTKKISPAIDKESVAVSTEASESITKVESKEDSSVISSPNNDRDVNEQTGQETNPTIKQEDERLGLATSTEDENKASEPKSAVLADVTAGSEASQQVEKKPSGASGENPADLSESGLSEIEQSRINASRMVH